MTHKKTGNKPNSSVKFVPKEIVFGDSVYMQPSEDIKRLSLALKEETIQRKSFFSSDEGRTRLLAAAYEYLKITRGTIEDPDPPLSAEEKSHLAHAVWEQEKQRRENANQPNK